MKHRTRWYALAAILLIAACLLLWGPWRQDDAAWARLQRGGALRVALDPSFPPFDTLDEKGEPAGFDVDLARELAARLGAPVQFQAIAFDGLVDAVIADRADAVISAFPLDPRLTRDVRYSRPYFEAGLVLVARRGEAVAGPEDLAGRVVAVEWGSGGDAWARAQGHTILRRETAAAALAAVAAGEAAAAAVDAVTFALSASPDLVALQPPLQSDPYVIILPLDAPRLATALDEALAALLADGTWARLAAPYFPQPPPLPPHSPGTRSTTAVLSPSMGAQSIAAVGVRWRRGPHGGGTAGRSVTPTRPRLRARRVICQPQALLVTMVPRFKQAFARQLAALNHQFTPSAVDGGTSSEQVS